VLAPSATSTPASNGDVGLVLAGRYRLIEPLGRGGMGRVYRAHDKLLDRDVALKLLFEDATADSELRRACATEARVASRLTHPGVARVLDSGVEDGRCFVVSELIEGRTLAKLLREDGAMPVGRALDLAIELADALAAVHLLGIVHCDVKPSNVIVASDGHARLVDFGIARTATMTTGLTDEALRGSAEYVAPEQVQGGHLDGRVDLYALGVVLYEMIAGQTPFGGGTLVSVVARRLVVDPPALSEQATDVPSGLDLAVQRALARQPDRRFRTAAELREALIGVRAALAPNRTAPAPFARQIWTLLASSGLPRLRAHPLLAASIVPVLLALVASTMAVGGSQDDGSPVVEAAPAPEPALVASVTAVPTSIPVTATSLPPASTLVPAPLAAETATPEPAKAAHLPAGVPISLRPTLIPSTPALPADEPTPPTSVVDVPSAAGEPSAVQVAPTSAPLAAPSSVPALAPSSSQPVPTEPAAVPAAAPAPNPPANPPAAPPSARPGPPPKSQPAPKSAPAPTQSPPTQPAPTVPPPTQPAPTRQSVTEPTPKPGSSAKPPQRSTDPVQTQAPTSEKAKDKGSGRSH